MEYKEQMKGLALLSKKLVKQKHQLNRIWTSEEGALTPSHSLHC